MGRCHTGRTFVVNETTFPQFLDLILPHVENPRKRAALALEFSACRPLWEEDPEPVTVFQPAATQLLWVALVRVGVEPRSATTDLDPLPAAADKKKKKKQQPWLPQPSPDSAAKLTHCPLEDEVCRLCHQMRRYKEEMSALRRCIDRLEHADDRRRH